MNIQPIKTRLFQEHENITDFILESIPIIKENSVIAITSKIISLSQGRTVAMDAIDKEVLIKQESDVTIRGEHTWITIRDKDVCLSSGIDASNGNGKYILLPNDPFQVATEIRTNLQKKYNLKNLGITITDSRTRAFRAGALGVALGYAGFRGLEKHHAKPDLFGRPLTVSRTNVADSLATTAVLVMGETNESQPLAVITNVPVHFCETVDTNELALDAKDDIYADLYKQKNDGI